MSEQRGEIAARLGTMTELEEVLSGMRGMAAARIQQGERAQSAAREYAGRIGAALAAMTTDSPTSPPHAPRSTVAIALCTDRGFVGALNEHVLDAARDVGAEQVIVVGSRGRSLADERGMPIVDGGSMAGQLGTIGDVADRMAALLARLARHSGAGFTAAVIHPRRAPSGAVIVTRRPLLPIAVMSRRTPPPFRPITTMPPLRLAAEIGGEYVHAQLFEMVAEAFTAANAASLEVLQSAHTHLDDMVRDLRRSENSLRQEEITAEALELIAGRMQPR